MKVFLKKLFGYCPQCKRLFVYPVKRRMNTQYVDDEKNFCNVCKKCFERVEEYWDDMWDDFYTL